MADQKPINSCQRCGGTAYKPILQRNVAGAMAPSGQYKCVQCGVVFTTIHQWRGDAVTTVNSTSKAASPHDF